MDQPSIASIIKNLIGNVPRDKRPFTQFMRLHQGWWRTFVLMEKPGQHPSKPSETVCNTITGGETTLKNFLTPNLYKAYAETIQNNLDKSQMIEEKRAVNNLLSSQPLCFNAFGEMSCDLHLATEFIKLIFLDAKDVTKVVFEYRPKEYEIDHSAFDVAFKFETNDGKRNLWGFEVKYTDGFSPVAKDRKEYAETFAKNKEHFLGEYDSYRTIEFNELFRNELIGRWCINNDLVDKVYTGIFCHHNDTAILSAAKNFQKTIRNGYDNFRIITYRDFLSSLQKMDLSWQQREWSMLFWARYCGTELSKGINASI